MRQIMIILAVLFLGCMDTNIDDPFGDARAELDAQAAVAIALANSGTCVSVGSCRKIGFGAKPCGGVRGFLVYSNSIDTVRLASLVQNYNAAEAQFNLEWSLTSDCSVMSPPDSLTCASGKCVGYYKGVLRPN